MHHSIIFKPIYAYQFLVTEVSCLIECELYLSDSKTDIQSELVGDVAVPVSVRQAVLF